VLSSASPRLGSYPHVPDGRKTIERTASFNPPIPEQSGVQVSFVPPYEVDAYKVTQQLLKPLTELIEELQPESMVGYPNVTPLQPEDPQ